MSETAPFLHNRWYVAALSTEVSDKPLARTLLNQPIVLYRDTRGAVIALEDRCVHRQAPLSLGEVVGDHIQCGYHGFTFDGSGACVRVPSQDRIPPGACVRSYPVIEKQGFVHVWPGDADPAANRTPFDFPFAVQAGLNARYASLRGQFDYRLLIDNLMDLTHLSFTHKNTIGAGGVAEGGKTGTERDGDKVRVTRQMEDIAPAPTHVEVTGYTGNVDRWQVIDFIPPCFVELQVGNAKAGRGGLSAAPENKLIDRRTLHIATPETETTTLYFWVSTYPSNAMSPDQEQLIYDRTMEVLDEDVRIIEGQQSRLDPTVPNVDINEDAGQIAMRAQLARLIAEENEEA
jgi:phenylpropionate dioxygenase-like ring-hydroxylating dioxygenase large terminal subunit